MKRKLLILSLFFSLIFLIEISSNVYADDNGTDLNLTSFPILLAEKLSISNFAGGILASLIIMLAFILPTALYTKSILPPMFVGVLCLGFCIAINWLDYWFLLVVAMLIAFMFGKKMSDIITGSGA